jgi:hypothetical protein
MAKYIFQLGKGYLVGLPSRDMTEDEWKSYPKDITKAALKLGLYEEVKTKDSEVKDA